MTTSPEPVISGITQSQTITFDSTAPFAGTTISDPDPTATFVLDLQIDGGTANGTLSGTGLFNVGDSSSGDYGIEGTAAQITTDLNDLSFQGTSPSPAGEPVTVGINYSLLSSTNGSDVLGQGQVDVTHEDQFLIVNSWAESAGYENGTPYTGPVPGIQTQFGQEGTYPPNPALANTPDQLVSTLGVTSYTPDVFVLAGQNYAYCSINTSAGGGTNILDAGAGSDFLTGGTGDNQFYLDARNLSINQWDTVSDLHSGDGVTLWGVTTSDFALTWLNGQGAPGYTGLTGVFVAYGKPEVGITLAGYSTADLTNGRLAITYGKTEDLPGLPGSLYMNITAT